MFKLVLGEAKKGKTYQVMQEIKAAIHDGNSHRVLLIVPEQYTLEAEKQLIEKLDTPGFIGVEVLSFKRLCHKLFQELGRDEAHLISDVGKMMLLRKVLSERQGELKVYGSVTQKVGFLEKVYDTYQMLKQAMVTLETLRDMVSAISDQPLLKAKLEDIAIVYEAYEAEIETRYVVEEVLYNVALSLISESLWLKDAFIWVDGFDSFTGQEYALLEHLAYVSKNVTITLCMGQDPQREMFQHTHMAVKRFTDMASKGGIPFETFKVQYQGDHKVLSFLAENILCYPYEVYPQKTDAIQVYAGSNRASELEYCVQDMIHLVRDHGYSWRDFAVVTNALDAYLPTIQSVFRHYDIPFFLDAKADALTHPLVHLILSSVKAYVFPQGYLDVTQALKSDYFQVRVQDISAFEMYLKENGYSLWHIKQPFQKKASFDYPLDALNATRLIFLSKTEALGQVVDSKESKVVDYVKAIVDMLLALDVFSTLENDVQGFIKAQNYEQAQRYSQIWNLIMGVFEELVQLTGQTHMTGEGFLSLLLAGIETLKVGQLPLSENTVIVGSLDRSKAHPIKKLYCIGVNDGILPEQASDGQLIGDREKDILQKMGYGFLPDQHLFANKEAFNIYMALTRPSESMCISYSRSNAEGGSLRPSYFIAKILKIFPKLEVKQQRLSDELKCDLQQIASEKSVFTRLAYVLRREKDGAHIDPRWQTVCDWYMESMPEKWHLLQSALHFENQVMALPEPVLRELYPMPIKTSVSRLEEYVQCPFKYLVSTGLSPKHIKPLRLDYPDVGLMFHEALEIFGKKVYLSGESWDTLTDAALEGIVDGIIDDMVNIDVFSKKHAYRYMINKLRRVSKRAALTLTRHLKQGKFTPAAFELAFSEKGVPMIPVELSNGKKLFLRAVIDRVDLMDVGDTTYVNIIDYKSGAKSLDFNEVYHGLQMQLITYLNACVKRPDYFKKESLEPAGAFYFKIDDPLLQTTEQLTERLQEELAQKLKLDGVVINVEPVIKGMDEKTFDMGQSDVIQVKLKADGSFTKDSKVIEADVLKGMMSWVEKTTQRIGEALYQGKFEVKPCKYKQFTSCSMCQYQSMCQFDLSFSNNQYRHLKPLDEEEMFSMMMKQEEIHGKMDS